MPAVSQTGQPAASFFSSTSSFDYTQDFMTNGTQALPAYSQSPLDMYTSASYPTGDEDDEFDSFFMGQPTP